MEVKSGKEKYLMWIERRQSLEKCVLDPETECKFGVSRHRGHWAHMSASARLGAAYALVAGEPMKLCAICFLVRENSE